MSKLIHIMEKQQLEKQQQKKSWTNRWLRNTDQSRKIQLKFPILVICI